MFFDCNSVHCQLLQSQNATPKAASKKGWVYVFITLELSTLDFWLGAKCYYPLDLSANEVAFRNFTEFMLSERFLSNIIWADIVQGKFPWDPLEGAAENKSNFETSRSRPDQTCAQLLKTIKNFMQMYWLPKQRGRFIKMIVLNCRRKPKLSIKSDQLNEKSTRL